MKQKTYPVYSEETLYLYDTQAQRVIKVFDSVKDVRDWLENFCLRLSENGERMLISPGKTALSMSLSNIRYVLHSSFGYWDEDAEMWVQESCHTSDLKDLVIIDENYRIFNYMGIWYELCAYLYGDRITYGIGKTYKGDTTDKQSSSRYYYWRRSCKPKHRSRDHLIISKSERVDSYDIGRDEIRETAEECELREEDVKKAYKSMRPKRYEGCINRFTDPYARKYHSKSYYRSWKNKKRRSQWGGGVMNKKRRKRLREDYVKLKDVRDDIKEVLDDESDGFNNLSEGLQATAQGQQSEEAIDVLDDTVDSIDEALSSLREVL